MRARRPAACDAAEDRRAVAVRALVRVDLGQLALREPGQLAGDLLRGERLVVGDREVAVGGPGTVGLPLGAGDGRRLARLARGALGRGGRLAAGVLGRLAGLAHGVGGTRGRDVIGALALDIGAHHRLGQLGDLAQQALEHLLLVGADRRGQLGRLVVADRPCQALDRRVGRDLQALAGASVLGVLEHLLLAAGAAQQVERRLAQRERLPDDRLDGADYGHHGIRALAELLQAALDALRVLARLAAGASRARCGRSRAASSRPAPAERARAPARWRAPRRGIARPSVRIDS